MSPFQNAQRKAFRPGLRVNSLVDKPDWLPRAVQKGDQGVIDEIDERQTYIKVDFGGGVKGWLVRIQVAVEGKDTPADLEHGGVPSRKGCSPVASSNDCLLGLLGQAANLDDKCKILKEQLQSDDSSQLQVVADELAGHVWEFSQHPSGCRVVQDALGLHRIISDKLVAELHGHVYASTLSPHANHVVQRVIVEKPPTQSSFIPGELMGSAGEVARHRFGCRLVIRLVEHCMDEPNTMAFVNEVLEQASELCHDRFGCHVMNAILEHGGHDHQHRIAIALRDAQSSYLMGNRTMRIASSVILKALEFCSASDKQYLCHVLLGCPDSVLQIANHQDGVRFLTKLFEDPMANLYKEMTCSLISCSARKLNKRCKKALDALQVM